MATKLQTSAQREETRGRAFAYARKLLMTDVVIEGAIVGRAPFSHIDAETIAQKAWRDGYITALRDMRKGEVTL